MNTVFFTGNVGKDGEIRSVGGSDVLNFSVAVRQGRDKGTEWYRVAVWGARANQLSQYIVKGAKVAVCGELSIGSYNDKPQFDVRAHEVDPFCGGKREEAGHATGSGSAAQSAPSYSQADLDDDVPF